MGEPATSRGFTVVELLTVIAIIMITSVIAIPLGLSYVRNYEVIGAATSIATLMQQARAQAVKRNSRRGILLNFDYPQLGQFQYTTLDENPVTGGWDGGIYPANPGVFDPSNRNYGTAPVPPNNVDPAGPGLPSPHGAVIVLPTGMQFIGGQTFTSLLFRMDGTVEAVNAGNVGSLVVAANGLDWVVRILHPQYGLTRTINISRNGRVVVSTP